MLRRGATVSDIEKQIREALEQTCGCIDGPFEEWDEDRTVRMYPGGPRALLNCPDCLPKRIAAAIEAATYSIMSTKDDITNVALRALKGEP